MACIAFPRASDRNWQNEYVTEIQRQGWQFVGGAGPVFWFERPIAGGDCSQRLNMMGWILGDPAEVAKLGTEQEGEIDWSLIPEGTFIFSVDERPACGSARYAQ